MRNSQLLVGARLESRHAGEAAFTPANVRAIEVYPPEKPRPTRFLGSDENCGAVVMWTK